MINNWFAVLCGAALFGFAVFGLVVAMFNGINMIADINLSEYHLSGMASATFTVLSVAGLWLQIKFIHVREKLFAAGQLGDERPTQTLSLNRFSSSYVGIYSLMMYGLCFAQLNHYIVWPRLFACVLVLIILHAMMKDRKDRMTTTVFSCGVALLAAAIFIRMFGPGVLFYSALVARVLVVVGMILYLQGSLHQVIKIRRERRTGGLSLPMHFLFFVKDLFSVWFAIVMGMQDGWPLLLANGFSLVVQCVFIGHFYWIRRLRKGDGLRDELMGAK